MIRALLPMLALCLPLPLAAQSFACRGTAPDWTLTLSTEAAELDHGRRTLFEIPHRVSAEGRFWPRAFTLVADYDTAIVLIAPGRCDGGLDYTAQVLTQRGQTPILLVGCCEARP